MSYVGYIPFVKERLAACLSNGSIPRLLEIGVDRGVTLIPLVAFLARTGMPFVAVGVDVKIQEQVALILSNIDVSTTQKVFCIESNSLDVLPKLVASDTKFDVVLIDGDHNYYTVSRELQIVEGLVHDASVIVCDDYDGRWSEVDLWYAERPGYEDISTVTPRVETEKHGVKAAVDEWLASHPAWRKHQPIRGEPVLLVKTC